MDKDPSSGLLSHLTLLLYLTAPSSGGETAFYLKRGGREVLSVAPEPGLLLLHEQGARCLLHEGRPVGQGGGDKWVLRSDVCLRRMGSDETMMASTQ